MLSHKGPHGWQDKSMRGCAHLALLILLLGLPSSKLPFVRLLLLEQIFQDCFSAEQVAIWRAHRILHR